MKRREALIGLIGMLLGALFSMLVFLFWVTSYKEDFDPKNIDYVLWKHGLNQNMNLDHALGGMTHDIWAVRLVDGPHERTAP